MGTKAEMNALKVGKNEPKPTWFLEGVSKT